MSRWEGVLFVLGAMMLSFAVGVVAGVKRWPPYETLREAQSAVEALVAELRPRELPEYPTTDPAKGVVRWERDLTQPGVNFLVRRGPNGNGAVLIDMEGNVLHEWKLELSDVWTGETPHLLRSTTDDRVTWEGVHLYPNGDIVLNFGGGTFPNGAGLVKIDKDSRILWKLPLNAHHALHVLPDGRIATLSHVFNSNGVAACAPYFAPPFLEDHVTLVSDGGEILESFSLLEALCDSPFAPLLMPAGSDNLMQTPRLTAEDPQHTNDVEVLTAQQAGALDGAAEGDFLVSFRNLNMVALIDRETHRAKRVLQGDFARQHDPDVMPDGTILIYDNMGGDAPGGRSRLLQLDPRSQRIVWQYEGSAEDRFQSSIRGTESKLPNGNVLAVSPVEGRAFEIAGTGTPRIVWEYVNLIRWDGQQGTRGQTIQIDRIDPATLTFLPAAAS